jgi:hypothetical protein
MFSDDSSRYDFDPLFKSLSAFNREQIAKERGDKVSAEIARQEAEYWD